MPTVRNLKIAATGDAPVVQAVPPTITEARERIQEHQHAIAGHEQAIEVLEEYIELVGKLGSLNGSGGGVGGMQRRKNPHQSPTVTKIGAPTGLLEAIRALAPKMPSPFAANDFLPKLHGIQFKGDPKSAVRDAVLSLRKKEVFKLVEIGKGGNPNRYEVQK